MIMKHQSPVNPFLTFARPDKIFNKTFIGTSISDTENETEIFSSAEQVADNLHQFATVKEAAELISKSQNVHRFQEKSKTSIQMLPKDSPKNKIKYSNKQVQNRISIPDVSKENENEHPSVKKTQVENISQSRCLKNFNTNSKPITVTENKSNVNWMARNLDNHLRLTLLGCGLDHYFRDFKRHNISYLDFLRLNDDDLFEIGIRREQDRVKLCELINDITSTAFSDKGISVPIRISKNITCGEQFQFIANIQEHLSRLIGSRHREDRNRGIINLHHVIERNPLALLDSSVLNINPINNLLSVVETIEEGCDLLNSKIEHINILLEKQNSEFLIKNRNTPANTDTNAVLVRMPVARGDGFKFDSKKWKLIGATSLVFIIGSLSYFALK